MDAKLNSPSNGDTFKWGHWAKRGVWGEILEFWRLPANISCWYSLMDPCWLSNWLCWMQNWILRRMTVISKARSLSKKRIRTEILCFWPYSELLEKFSFFLFSVYIIHIFFFLIFLTNISIISFSFFSKRKLKFILVFFLFYIEKNWIITKKFQQKENIFENFHQCLSSSFVM